MAGPNRKLSLLILGNAKSAIDALRLTDSSSQKMGRTIASVSKNMTIAFGVIGAAGAYMGKQVFDGAMMSIRGAMEDQRSKELLAKQIRELTNATDGNLLSVERQISRLEQSAAVADDVLRPALANLVRATGDVTKAQGLLSLALDISAGTGKDLESVSLALGKAATGNVGALTRLGIPLDENAKKTKDFEAITNQLARTFQGASATSVDTFEGRLRQLRIGFDNVIEAIGYALLPFAEKMVAFISNNVVPALQVFADNLKERGLAGAAVYAIASLGQIGDRGIDAMEKITLAVLTATKQIVDMAEKLALIVTLYTMVTGNAAGFAKAWASGFSADVLQDKLSDAIANTPAMFDRLRGSVDAASKAIDQSKQGLGDWTRNQNDVNKATGKGKGSFDALGGAVGGASNAIAKATDRIAAYNKALKSSNDVKNDAVRASKQMAQAENAVAKSLANLERARKRFTQITKGYGADSKQASDAETERAKAQRESERAGYAYEQALFAVSDAEKALADLRADSEATPQQIREAEIRLAEARLSVADASDAQKESVFGLAEAERLLDMAINGAKEGTIEYQDALEDLRSAEESHLATVDALTDAREREAEAIRKVKEAEEELAKMRAALPQGAVIDATTGEASAPPLPAFPNFMAAVRGLHPDSSALRSGTPVRAAKIAFPKLYAEYKKAGKALAEGGIVNRPTEILAGEKGPEAIIPLDKISALGQTNIHVTINAGMGVDPAKVGDEIVNVLQRYNRRNGALPLRVI